MPFAHALSPAASDLEFAPAAHSSSTTIVAGIGEPKQPSLRDSTSPPAIQTEIEARPLPTNLRRWCLLVIFCLAQFFERVLCSRAAPDSLADTADCVRALHLYSIFSGSAVLIAVPDMSEALGMSPAEGTWLVNAYTLALAASMLAAGRVSDMFSAKWTFVVGLAWVGIFSLGIGLASDKILVIVLRAFSGIGAAATIPAALNLIAHLFPGEKEQALAISMYVQLEAGLKHGHRTDRSLPASSRFSGCGAIANVVSSRVTDGLPATTTVADRVNAFLPT